MNLWLECNIKEASSTLLSNGLWQTEKFSTAAEDEAGSSAEDLTLLSCFTRHSSTLLAASVVVGGLAALPIGYLGYWLRATVTFGQEGLCRREGSVAKLDDGLVKDGEGIVEIGSVPEDDEGEQSVVPARTRTCNLMHMQQSLGYGRSLKFPYSPKKDITMHSCNECSPPTLTVETLHTFFSHLMNTSPVLESTNGSRNCLIAP